jgi:hypothetical protein
MTQDDTLRTAIYVHEPSTVTVRAKDPSDTTAQLYGYKRGAMGLAIGTHLLPRGIYLVLSKGPVEVSNTVVMTAVLGSGKDIPPDLTASVVALESGAGATAQSIQEFFLVAKGIGDDDDSDEIDRD